VALGSLGTPMVLQGFRSSDDLMRANPHCFKIATPAADLTLDAPPMPVRQPSSGQRQG